MTLRPCDQAAIDHVLRQVRAGDDPASGAKTIAEAIAQAKGGSGWWYDSAMSAKCHHGHSVDMCDQPWCRHYPEAKPSKVVCECGGAKTSGTHSHWCPVEVASKAATK